MSRGSIRRRGKASWELKWDVPNPGGPRKSKTLNLKGTRDEAERKLVQLLRERDTGTACRAAARPAAVDWGGGIWMEDPLAYDAAVKAAQEVLELARPPGAVEPYERPFSIAEMVTSFLKGTAKPPPAYSLEIRQLLTPGLLKRILANAKKAMGVTA